MIRNIGRVPSVDSPGPRSMLCLATIGFTICFRAWALLATLGPRLRDELGLSSCCNSKSYESRWSWRMTRDRGPKPADVAS